MKFIAWVLAGALGCTVIPTFALACGDSIENGVISVQQKSTIVAKADAALVRFNISADAESAELATKTVTSKGDQFAKELKAKFPGIKYVEVSDPRPFSGGEEDGPPWMPERATAPSKPSAMVRVTVLMAPNPKDVVRATDLARSFQAKTQTNYRYEEGMSPSPVQYGLLDIKTTEKPLRDKVLKEAKERAELWASAIGKEIGEVRKIELACGSTPTTVNVSDSGKSALELYYPGASPEAIKVELTATLVYSLAPMTH